MIGLARLTLMLLSNRTALAALVALGCVGPLKAADAVTGLYATHCAVCHGGDRLGGVGPALLPDNLGRLVGDRLKPVIAEGREATQMPAYKDILTAAEIAELAAYISKPPAVPPVWTEVNIRDSRVTLAETPADLKGPTYPSDPLNIFVVVETGDSHATILDGDRMEPLTRFPTRFALHGGPKFSPDGRFVYFMSRDGWITKYDIWTLTAVAEVRAGINSRNIAMSSDGKHLAVANYLPNTLVILSAADLSVVRVLPVRDAAGAFSRVSAVYQARPRGSFIAALKDVSEIWEIDPSAPGMQVRRIVTPEPLDDFFFDPAYAHVAGSSRQGKAYVLDLDKGAVVKTLPLPGLPHLGSGIAWAYGETPVMATPHLREGKVTVIDMTDWRPLAVIDTPGPGFFMRSHENTPYAWTDGMLGPRKDTMSIIDKRTLKIVREVTPSPGKVAAHVEFDRHGKHALVSVWEKDGALVIYDAATFEEKKRIPMSKPSGKYNVHNKITFSDGTSH
jgi:mono/diheme cytochrome c family protein/DNA-binding beta-propeller fold protein YncE